jgi:hypothetical protein
MPRCNAPRFAGTLTAMPDRPPEPSKPDDFRKRQRSNLIVLGIVAVLVIGTAALMVSLHHGIDREDCFAAGHHTCAPISEQP